MGILRTDVLLCICLFLLIILFCRNSEAFGGSAWFPRTRLKDIRISMTPDYRHQMYLKKKQIEDCNCRRVESMTSAFPVADKAYRSFERESKLIPGEVDGYPNANGVFQRWKTAKNMHA